ncbi:MAG: T9SS type A sorting domain-containing protein, partial [bacterium]|nr:T9SS type A sorting domain-containing protein [bacterium]
YLTSGSLDASDAEVTLTMADGSEIKRATGVLASAPTFAGQVDLGYTSSTTSVTTGPELPVGTGVLADLTLSGTMGVTLGADATVNGTCTISGSALSTDMYTLTLGPTATLAEAAGLTVLGTVTATGTVAQSVNEVFGGIGLEMMAAGAAPGATEVVRTTGLPVDKDAADGILRNFAVTPTVNTGLDATVVFRYDETELNGIEEFALVLYANDGSGWAMQVSTLDSGANTVTGIALDSFSQLTLGVAGVVAAQLQSTDVSTTGTEVSVTWSLLDPIPVEDFQPYRLVGVDRRPVPLEDAVITVNGSSYGFTDRGSEPGIVCSYRVDVSLVGQVQTLFETQPVEIPAQKFNLGQNFPNPFNPVTDIAYNLPKSGHVTLDIYDVAGRHVDRIVDAVQDAGPQKVVWKGVDRAGNPVASGTYFYRLNTDTYGETRKMLLMK